MPDAAQDPRPVVLDGLARAATVAALATGEVDGEVVLGEREAGGHAFDHGAQHRPVALAGRDEPEALHVAAGAGQPAAGSAAGSAPEASAAGSPSADRRPLARASASAAPMTSSGAGWPVHRLNAAAPWWSSI